MNEKIIAREVAPGAVDFRFYFDDDGLKSAGGENCAVYIPRIGRGYMGFNADEYEGIVTDAENIIDEYNNGSTITAACEYALNGNDFERIRNNTHKLHALKKWAENANTNDAGDIAEYLTITTGEPWTTRNFTGYCQGDYCTVVYCTAHHSAEGINEIGNFWLGCGTEFIIDDCGGYFVLDTIRWREGEHLRTLLAEYAGCDPADLEIYLYDGSHTVDDYKIMEV